jgi:hypothetical protein
MSNARVQIRAAFTAFILFAASSALLLMLARGLGNVAAVLPLPKSLPSFAPLETISLLLDLRPFIVLGAAILLVAGIVLALQSAYLDRAVQMLASMLVLVLASIIGIIVGFSAFLAWAQHRLDVPAGALPLLACFAVVLLASFMRVESLRGSFLLRYALAVCLVVGAPILLLYSA